MSINSNPFYNRGPVREPAYFFGRRGEVQKLVQAIGAKIPQSISIIGERRIGKTSLLNYLAHPNGGMAEFSHFLSHAPEDYLFVRTDLATLKIKTGQLNPALFFFRLLFNSLEKTVQERTGQSFPSFERYWNTAELAELVEFGIGGYLDELRKAHPELVIVFLLDEADALIRLGVGALLRSMIQDRLMSFVLVTRLPLIEIDPEREVSPLFNILSETIALNLMSQEEAHAMIREQDQGIFSTAEMDFILQTGGLHPDFTLVTAHRLWETRKSGLEFEPDALFEQVATDLASACKGLWDGMTESEQAFCLKLTDDEQKTGNSDAVQVLKRKGILNKQNLLFSPVLLDFIKRIPIETARTNYATQEIQIGEKYAQIGAQTILLSPREQLLLTVLYKHKNEICSREQLHLALWGTGQEESSDVKLNVNIQRLRRKLEPTGVQIELVRGSGYRLLVNE